MGTRGQSRWAAAAGWAAVLTLRSASTRADPPPVDLEWSAPASCPDRARVLEAVERLLTRDAARPASALRARGDIERTGDGWSLRLTIDRDAASATRTLEDASCDELGRSAALILALAIDPDARAESPTKAAAAPNRAAEPAPIRPGTAAAPAEPDRAARNEAVRRERWALGWSASAAGLLDLAALPAAAPGVGAAAGISFGRVELDALATYLFAEDAYASDGRAGATLSLASGGLRVCYTALRAAIDLAACMRLEAGVMWGDGFGVLAPGSASALWLAPGPGLVARVPLAGPLSVQLGVDALVPLARQRFVLVGMGEVHRAPPITGRGGIGLELAYR